MRLSVMIPAYKAVDTLDRCLNSILPQLPSDSEVILVEDGSPDETGTLCDRWAERDPRVRALHQPNGGASAARNRALSAARGDYLQFVDADDELLPGIYEAVLPRLDAGAEICLFACINAGQAQPNERIAPVSSAALSDLGREEIERYLFTTGVLFAPYNKIFTRALRERSGAVFDTRLPVNEDVDFNFRLLPHCRSLSALPETYYLLHLENEQSLSRQFRTDLCRCTRLVLPRLRNFLSACGYSGQEAEALTLRYERDAACRQYSLLSSRPGPLAARRAGLRELLSVPAYRLAIQEQLKADPNPLALPLRLLVSLRQPSLLALLFQLRIH